MTTINLSIYKGFDRKNCLGWHLTPSIITHGQIPCKFSDLLSSLDKIAGTMNLKICGRTTICVLNLNLRTEI